MKPHPAGLILATALAGCAALPPDPPRSDQVFADIQVGMSQHDVQRRLGRPDETMRFSPSRVAWDYRYTDSWGYFAVFSVTFDAAGNAVERFSWRTNDGGDHQ